MPNVRKGIWLYAVAAVAVLVVATTVWILWLRPLAEPTVVTNTTPAEKQFREGCGGHYQTAPGPLRGKIWVSDGSICKDDPPRGGSR